MGDVLLQRRECLFNVVHECRAAGESEKALVRQLLGLGVGDHIRAERGFYDVVEAEPLDAGDDLSELCIGELAGDGGRDDGVQPVFGIALTAFDKVDDVQYIRFVRDGAERALIYAGAAGDTFVVVNRSRKRFFVPGDGFDLTGVFAGALVVGNRAVGADLGAGAALDAFFFVDDGALVLVEADGTALADVLAAVCDTAAAGLGDSIAAHRAFVAGDVDDLDDVGVLLVAAERHADAFADDGALLVNAAAHRRLRSLDDHLGNLGVAVEQSVFESQPRDFTKDFVFQKLYLGIELSHRCNRLLSQRESFLLGICECPPASAGLVCGAD